MDKEVYEKRRQEVAAMDLDTARVELANAIYAAARLFEELESAGKIVGNGHHLRQEVAVYAEDLLKRRFRDK